jgi:hypothetical protein
VAALYRCSLSAFPQLRVGCLLDRSLVSSKTEAQRCGSDCRDGGEWVLCVCVKMYCFGCRIVGCNSVRQQIQKVQTPSPFTWLLPPTPRSTLLMIELDPMRRRCPPLPPAGPHPRLAHHQP